MRGNWWWAGRIRVYFMRCLWSQHIPWWYRRFVKTPRNSPAPHPGLGYQRSRRAEVDASRGFDRFEEHSNYRL